MEPAISIERITKMRNEMDRLETNDVGYYFLLRESYKKIIAKNPQKYRVVNANCSIIELFNKVIDILQKEKVL
ncbi:thymidylate kinase [Metamycoplasma alkalescens]|uniref:Thymidylate kinase n=1 Tax=Metamycoplasma alkalescens TaxID=45363 RepID=A0A3B0PFK3_9BACT|nr:thymidylate kinase [Metamycoplasma alkalescens]